MNISKLSLQEKIGQRFMFGVNSDNIDIIINLIENYHIGGVILYKKNYSSYDEMLSVIKRFKKANSKNKIPLFIAIDQEGGRVNRLPSEFNNVKNIYDISKKNIDLVSDSGIVTGKVLSSLGINMNFAPVLDLTKNNMSKILYNRCFYGDIDSVSLASMKYIDGIRKNNIISVPKHFPGHGISSVDSHFITPYVFDKNKILDEHIKPFDNVISNGIDALMVGHLVIRGMTDGVPASISYNFINRYLRKRSNYNGLVITDEINMLSHNLFYKFNYMKKAIMSGSDIILFKIKSNNVFEIIDKCIKYVSEHDQCIKLLDESVNRIIKIKNKYNVNDDINYDKIDIVEINKMIDKLNANVIK